MESFDNDNKIIQITNNKWKFPERISFSSVSHYIINIDKTKIKDTITFDLTDTHEIHSSFLGFLIDIKRKIDTNHGRLELHLSPYMKEILNQIDLYDHLVKAS